MTWLLLWFGFAIIRLDPIARALAAEIIRDHDLAYLAQETTERELARRYGLLAVETGLPYAAAGRVAAMAWRHVVEAQSAEPPRGDRLFSFFG